MTHYPPPVRQIDYSGLPAGLQTGIADYIERGIPPGGFVRAVLCNDLMAAAQLADPENRRLLGRIACWFIEYAPSECWGDSERVANWLRGGGR